MPALPLPNVSTWRRAGTLGLLALLGHASAAFQISATYSSPYAAVISPLEVSINLISSEPTALSGATITNVELNGFAGTGTVTSTCGGSGSVTQGPSGPVLNFSGGTVPAAVDANNLGRCVVTVKGTAVSQPGNHTLQVKAGAVAAGGLSAGEVFASVQIDGLNNVTVHTTGQLWSGLPNQVGRVFMNNSNRVALHLTGATITLNSGMEGLKISPENDAGACAISNLTQESEHLWRFDAVMQSASICMFNFDTNATGAAYSNRYGYYGNGLEQRTIDFNSGEVAEDPTISNRGSSTSARFLPILDISSNIVATGDQTGTSTITGHARHEERFRHTTRISALKPGETQVVSGRLSLAAPISGSVDPASVRPGPGCLAPDITGAGGGGDGAALVITRVSVDPSAHCDIEYDLVIPASSYVGSLRTIYSESFFSTERYGQGAYYELYMPPVQLIQDGSYGKRGSEISMGQMGTYHVIVENDTPTPMTGVGFYDRWTHELLTDSAQPALSTCGASVATDADRKGVRFSGATIAPYATCIFTIQIDPATTMKTGWYYNELPQVTTDSGHQFALAPSGANIHIVGNSLYVPFTQGPVNSDVSLRATYTHRSASNTRPLMEFLLPASANYVPGSARLSCANVPVDLSDAQVTEAGQIVSFTPRITSTGDGTSCQVSIKVRSATEGYTSYRLRVTHVTPFEEVIEAQGDLLFMPQPGSYSVSMTTYPGYEERAAGEPSYFQIGLPNLVSGTHVAVPVRIQNVLPEGLILAPQLFVRDWDNQGNRWTKNADGSWSNRMLDLGCDAARTCSAGTLIHPDLKSFSVYTETTNSPYDSLASPPVTGTAAREYSHTIRTSDIEDLTGSGAVFTGETSSSITFTPAVFGTPSFETAQFTNAALVPNPLTLVLYNASGAGRLRLHTQLFVQEDIDSRWETSWIEPKSVSHTCPSGTVAQINGEFLDVTTGTLGAGASCTVTVHGDVRFVYPSSDYLLYRLQPGDLRHVEDNGTNLRRTTAQTSNTLTAEAPCVDSNDWSAPETRILTLGPDGRFTTAIEQYNWRTTLGAGAVNFTHSMPAGWSATYTIWRPGRSGRYAASTPEAAWDAMIAGEGSLGQWDEYQIEISYAVPAGTGGRAVFQQQAQGSPCLPLILTSEVAGDAPELPVSAAVQMVQAACQITGGTVSCGAEQAEPLNVQPCTLVRYRSWAVGAGSAVKNPVLRSGLDPRLTPLLARGWATTNGTRRPTEVSSDNGATWSAPGAALATGRALATRIVTVTGLGVGDTLELVSYGFLAAPQCAAPEVSLDWL